MFFRYLQHIRDGRLKLEKNVYHMKHIKIKIKSAKIVVEEDVEEHPPPCRPLHDMFMTLDFSTVLTLTPSFPPVVTDWGGHIDQH
jgi:hypothetical protein